MDGRMEWNSHYQYSILIYYNIDDKHNLKESNLAEAQFSCNFIHSFCFWIIYQFQAVLSGILKQISRQCYNKDCLHD